MTKATTTHRADDTFTSRSNLAASVPVLAFATVAIHVAINAFGAYGFIRDELYYLACADHLAWGYVDHPPLSIAALWLSRLLFGDSLVAVRLLPALSGGTVVLLAGLLARELGGRPYAQLLAATCTLAAPLVLGMDSLFSMNSFDVLCWTAALYVFILALKYDRLSSWLILGLVLGLGLLNKISVLWLLAGLFAGIVLTPARRLILTRRAWLSAAIAAALFLPHVAWQVANGYPTLEFISNAGFGKYVPLSPGNLLLQQAMFMNPITFPLWMAGVGYFLWSRRARAFRVLPIVYLTVFGILAVNGNAKAAYLAPLLPMLFVLGAVTFERLADRTRWQMVKPLVVALVVASGVGLAPMVAAVLPVESYTRYAAALGVAPSTSERNALGRLPQHFADMFGWPEMVERIAAAYHSLAPDEQRRCAILCNNYGEAGAVDFFGRRQNLPRAISGHNNYWLWGPGEATGDVVIQLGGSIDALNQAYREVVQAGVVTNPYSMPYESNLPIWICRGRRTPLATDWMRLKVFN